MIDKPSKTIDVIDQKFCTLINDWFFCILSKRACSTTLLLLGICQVWSLKPGFKAITVKNIPMEMIKESTKHCYIHKNVRPHGAMDNALPKEQKIAGSSPAEVIFLCLFIDNWLTGFS